MANKNEKDQSRAQQSLTENESAINRRIMIRSGSPDCRVFDVARDIWVGHSPQKHQPGRASFMPRKSTILRQTGFLGGGHSTKVGLIISIAGIILVYYLLKQSSAGDQVLSALRKRKGNSMISTARYNNSANIQNGNRNGIAPTRSHIPEFDNKQTVYKSADLSGAIPDNVLKLRDSVKITEGRTDVMFTFNCAGDILLLHGQAFTSNNWMDINSLRTFAAAGYRTVAVDLPGYGQTGGHSLQNDQKPNFVGKLIESLGLHKPVLVSPSMSGSFSLPYVISNSQDLSAYVPVAPVGTGEFSPETYHKIKLPTLIVYGSRDTSLGVNSKVNLGNLPNGRVLKIEKAGHPAYLDQPEIFHSAMINFLDLVKTHGPI